MVFAQPGGRCPLAPPALNPALRARAGSRVLRIEITLDGMN